jgi:hypothetical protein
MKTKLFIALLIVGLSYPLFAADLITLKNGKENKSEIQSTDKNSLQIKKFHYLSITKFSIVKTEVLPGFYSNRIRDEIGLRAKESLPVSALQDNGRRPLGRVTFSADILGVLQYGPVFMFEIKTAPFMYLDAHVRYLFAGLLFHGVFTDWFSNGYSVKPQSLAAGLGLKFLFGSRNSKPYVGLFSEFGNGFGDKDDDYYGEIDKQTSIFIFGFQGGYRWRFENKCFISLGLIAGGTTYTDHYKYNSYTSMDYSEDGSRVYALLTFTFGFESK